MPAALTIFVAKYLIFLDLLVAVLVLFALLRRRPFVDLVRWGITVVIMLGLAFVLGKVGAHLYTDPRPFTQDHVRPLVSHARDNGFPSDHALLGAAIVAAVLLVSLPWSLLFVVLTILVDWARVAAGLHHVSDVVGSAIFVAIALLVGIAVAHALTPRVVDQFTPTRTRTTRSP